MRSKTGLIKLWRVLLSFVMIVSLMPAMAFADEEVTEYYLWLNNTQVTSENMDKLCGGKASFDPYTSILKFDDDVTLSKSFDSYAVYSECMDLTIDIAEGKTLTITDNALWVSEVDGEGGNLTINGNLNLTNVADFGIMAMNLTINGNVVSNTKISAVSVSGTIDLQRGRLEASVTDKTAALYASNGITYSTDTHEIAEPVEGSVEKLEGGIGGSTYYSVVNSDDTAIAKHVIIQPKSDETPTEPTDPTDPVEPVVDPDDNTPKDDSNTSDVSENAPKTGDNSNLLLWIVLLFVSIGGAISTVVINRRRKYNR